MSAFSLQDARARRGDKKEAEGARAGTGSEALATPKVCHDRPFRSYLYQLCQRLRFLSRSQRAGQMEEIFLDAMDVTLTVEQLSLIKLLVGITCWGKCLSGTAKCQAPTCDWTLNRNGHVHLERLEKLAPSREDGEEEEQQKQQEQKKGPALGTARLWESLGQLIGEVRVFDRCSMCALMSCIGKPIYAPPPLCSELSGPKRRRQSGKRGGRAPARNHCRQWQAAIHGCGDALAWRKQASCPA